MLLTTFFIFLFINIYKINIFKKLFNILNNFVYVTEHVRIIYLVDIYYNLLIE